MLGSYEPLAISERILCFFNRLGFFSHKELPHFHLRQVIRGIFFVFNLFILPTSIHIQSFIFRLRLQFFSIPTSTMHDLAHTFFRESMAGFI